ncbi:MAG: lipoyl(octanoyl) transferase LipB [Negativicutes bacterium]
MTKRCALIRQGMLTYEEGLQLQQETWDCVASGEWDGALILLEHFQVATLGRNHDARELLLSAEEYRERGIEVVHCNRGGKATCHNPGQLVGYPVLNLANWRQDSHWYLRLLEQTIMNTVEKFGISAGRKERYTGVWVGDQKIAAIGVALRRWITSHGFALNVNNDLAIFSTIVPCGINEFGVTSMLAEGVAGLSVGAVAEVFVREMEASLQCSFVTMER